MAQSPAAAASSTPAGAARAPRTPLEQRALAIAGELQSRLQGWRLAVPGAADLIRQWAPGLQAELRSRHSPNLVNGRSMDLAVERLLSGMLDASFADLQTAHQELLKAFGHPDVPRAKDMALDELERLKRQVAAMNALGPAERETADALASAFIDALRQSAQRPELPLGGLAPELAATLSRLHGAVSAEPQDRAGAIAAMLDEAVRHWPRNAPVDGALAGSLQEALGQHLDELAITLPSDELRALASRFLQAVLDASPMELAQIHGALVEAERGNIAPARLEAHVARAFDRLLDATEKVLLDAVDAQAETRTATGRAMANLFADALRSRAPDQPFTIRLDEVFMAREGAADADLRIRSGLLLTARQRLARLSSSGVIGPLRFVAAKVPGETPAALWSPLPGGGFSIAQDAAFQALRHYGFDPESDRVRHVADELDEAWDVFAGEVATYPMEDPADAALFESLVDLAASVIDDIAGIDALERPELSPLLDRAAWQERTRTAAPLIAALRNAPGADAARLRIAQELERLLSGSAGLLEQALAAQAALAAQVPRASLEAAATLPGSTHAPASPAGSGISGSASPASSESSDGFDDSPWSPRPSEDAGPSGPARLPARWTADETGALTIEQRASVIAAALQADTAHWPVTMAGADERREQLLPELRRAAAAVLGRLPESARDAVIRPMLEALLHRSPLRSRDAYLALLDAIDPARRRTLVELADTSITFRALKQVVWDRVIQSAGRASPHLGVATAQALIDVYIAALDASPGQRLQLDIDALQLHSQTAQASAGVRFALYDTLNALSRAGVIGSVATAGFDTAATSRSFGPAPIDPARPLRALAQLAPGLTQTWDASARTVALAWVRGGVHRHALVQLGAADADAALLRQLQTLDTLITAYVAAPGGADLDALPLVLTLSPDRLTDGHGEIARLGPEGWTFAAAAETAARSAAATAAGTAAGTVRAGMSTHIPVALQGPDRAGSVDVMTSLLREAVDRWSPAGAAGTATGTATDTASHDALIERYSRQWLQKSGGPASATLHPFARTLLAGILEGSVPTLHRAYELCIDSVRSDPRQAGRPAQVAAAVLLRRRVADLEALIAAEPDAPGFRIRERVLAAFYANLLVSSADPATPLTLNADLLEEALHPAAAPSALATAYARLVTAMRDQLALMTRTGVLGTVQFRARDERTVASGGAWMRDEAGGRWLTPEGLLLERWPTAAFDPSTGRVKVLLRSDLLGPWTRYRDKLTSLAFGHDEDEEAAGRLDDCAEEIEAELDALVDGPRRDRAAGMDATAWKRRVDKTLALRAEIARGGASGEVIALAGELVDVARRAADQAMTPAFQSAFGRGTLPAFEDWAALPEPPLRLPSGDDDPDSYSDISVEDDSPQPGTSGEPPRDQTDGGPAQGVDAAEAASGAEPPAEAAAETATEMAAETAAETAAEAPAGLPSEAAQAGGRQARVDRGSLAAKALVAARLDLQSPVEEAKTRIRDGVIDRILAHMGVELEGEARRTVEDFIVLRRGKGKLAALSYDRPQFIRPLDLLLLDETLVRVRELIHQQSGAAGSPKPWTPLHTLRFIEADDPTSWSGMEGGAPSAKRLSAELVLMALESARTKRPMPFDIDFIREWLHDVTPAALSLARPFKRLFPALEALSDLGLIGKLVPVWPPGAGPAATPANRADSVQTVRQLLQAPPDPKPSGWMPVEWPEPVFARPDMPMPAWSTRKHLPDGARGKPLFKLDKQEIHVYRYEPDGSHQDRFFTAKLVAPRGEFAAAFAAEVDEWTQRWSEGPGGVAIPRSRQPRYLRVDDQGMHVLNSAQDRFSIRVAERLPSGRLRFDPAAMRVVQAFLDRVVLEEPPRPPVTQWRNEMTPAHAADPRWIKAWHAVRDAEGEGEPAAKRARIAADHEARGKLRIVLQLDDSPAAFEAGLRYATKYKDKGGVAWVQRDARGGRRVVAGADLLSQVADRFVKLVIVGKSSLNALQKTRLSGHDPARLAELARDEVELHTGLDRVESVTLLSCALESPLADTSFGKTFRRNFVKSRLDPSSSTISPKLKVTTYSRPVLFPDHDPSSTTRYTRQWPGGPLRHHASETTFSIWSEVKREDKYLGGERHTLDEPADDPDTQYDGSALDVEQQRAAQPQPARSAASESGLMKVIQQTLAQAVPDTPARSFTPEQFRAWEQMRDDLVRIIGERFPEVSDAFIRRSVVATAHELLLSGTSSLHRMLDTLGRQLDLTSDASLQEAALTDGPFGDIDRLRIDEPLRQTLASGAKIRRRTALMLDLLDVTPALIEARPDIVEQPHRLAAEIRLWRAALASGLDGSPFFIDADLQHSRAGTPAPASTQRGDALHALYPALKQLAATGEIGPIRFISSDAARRSGPGWSALNARWSVTSVDQVPSPSPAAAGRTDAGQPSFLEGLRHAPDHIEWDLDRGEVRLTPMPGSDATVRLLFPASPEDRGAARANLDTLGRLMTRLGLIDLPARELPSRISLGADQFSANGLVLARRDDTGRWLIDEEAVRRLRTVMPQGESAAALPDLTVPANQWENHVQLPREPRVRAHLDEAREALRLYIAAQDDKAMEVAGLALLEKYGDRLVWVRMAKDGSWQVRAGRDLVNASAPETRLRLIVAAHGFTDPQTKARLLGGFTPEELARAIGRLLGALRPGMTSQVDSVRLLGCVLQSPAAERNFGAAFVGAAHDEQWSRPGMRATVYADRVGPDAGPSGLRFVTMADRRSPRYHRASGRTWQYWVEDGTVHHADKYADAGAGTLVPAIDEDPLTFGGPDDQIAAASPTPTETPLSAETLRVYRTLDALEQLPAWQGDDQAATATLRRELADQVLRVLVDFNPQAGEIPALEAGVLKEVSRHVAAGLLGKPGRLRQAYLTLLQAGLAADAVILSDSLWFPRAGTLPRTEQTLRAELGETRRIGAASGYVVEALRAAREHLTRTAADRGAGVWERFLGKAALMHAAVGAAATQGALVLDLSPGAPATDADIELVRARDLLPHLTTLGANGGAWEAATDSPYLRGKKVFKRLDGNVEHEIAVAQLHRFDLGPPFRHVVAHERDGRVSWSTSTPEDVQRHLQGIRDLFDQGIARLRAQRADPALLSEETRFINRAIEHLLFQQEQIFRATPTSEEDEDIHQAQRDGSLEHEELRGRVIARARQTFAELKWFTLASSDDRLLGLPPELPRQASDAARVAHEKMTAVRSGVARELERLRKELATRLAAVHESAVEPLPRRRPLAALASSAPQVEQTLDRISGEITLSHPLLERRTRIRVRPLREFQNAGEPERLAILRQDADIRQVESMLLRYFEPARRPGGSSPFLLPDLPPEVLLEKDTLEIGARIVANRDTQANLLLPPVWMPDEQNLEAARRTVWGAGYARAQEPPAFEPPEPLPEPPATARPGRKKGPGRVKVILQMADDRESATAAWLLAKRHGDAAVWISVAHEPITGGSSWTYRRGRSLVRPLAPSTEVDVQVVGHGRVSASFERTLSGWTPDQLATVINGLFPHFRTAPKSQRPQLKQVSLVACDLARELPGKSFALAFAEALDSHPSTRGAPVTARTGHLHVVQERRAGGSARIIKVTGRPDARGGGLRHHMPGDTLRITRDPVSGERIVTDKYPGPASKREQEGRWTAPPEDLDLAVDVTLGSDPVLEGDTPEERALRDIVEGAKDPLDLNRLSRVTAAQALRELQASGALEINAGGAIRLDDAHMASLIAGTDDAARMRVGTALLHLPEPLLDELHANSSARGQSLLEQVRKARAGGADRASGIDLEAVGGHVFGWANTILGALQIAQGWRHMDAAQKGLAVAQTSGIVTTPLTVKVGEWLKTWADDLQAVAAESRAGALAGSALSRLGTALMAGSADVGLAGLGLVLCGLQWRDFWKSGQPVGGFAYKSLVAGTTVATIFAMHALVSTGINLAVLAAGGAEAVAGTLLGAAAGVMSATALPFAIAAIALAGAVNAFMWADEYADYVDPATPVGEVILGTLAKMLGFETDAFKRAEVEKSAHDAAVARSAMLDQQRKDFMVFRRQQVMKSGTYNTVRYGHLHHPVSHTTFPVPGQDPPYAFVLQDHSPFQAVHSGQEIWRAPRTAGAVPRIAWLGLRGTVWPSLPGELGEQLFEVQGTRSEYYGGPKRDIFLLDGDSSSHVHGLGGADELVLDAGRRHVRIRPNGEDRLRYAIALQASGLDEARQNRLETIESITVRDAASAHVTGSAADERFDVSGQQTDIAGGGGRNTYVLRPGNRIVSSASDAAIWGRGISATIDFDGKPADTPLLLRADVLHESLSFRRDGTTLFIGNGADTLTLLDFFAATDAAPTAPRGLFIVDAVGTHLTLIDPRRLDGTARSATALDKHLSFDAWAPESRRALTGDHAHTRHHLSSGSGAFRVQPRTAMPMDITLDIDIARLRYARTGDDLILIETPPANAPADFKPLRLTLPGYAKRDWAASHGQLALWARGASDQAAVVKLLHPAPGDPDEGAMRRAEPDSQAAGSPANEPAAVPGLDGATQAPAMAEQASDVAIPAVSKKNGAKVYAADGRLPVQATAPGIHIIESGPAAPWSAARPRVIHVRPDATARMTGRSLEITAGEGADRTTVHVLDYFRAPGHFTFEPLSSETAWAMKQLTGQQSPPLLPQNFRGLWLGIYAGLDADPWIAPLLYAADIKDHAVVRAVSRISTDLRQEPSAKNGPAEDTAHDLAAVRTYLRLKGLSAEVANAIQSTTTRQLRRVRQLLAAASDGRTALPAAFIDAYAASSVDTPLNASHHGALIRSLAARALPWDYVEAVLKHGLSSQALLAFEAWASQHAQGGLAGAHAIRAMEEFDRLLDGSHGADAAITPDTRALLAIALRLDGRPDDVIDALADAMVAVTLDRDWVDGMLRAGVDSHEVLKQLRSAKVPVQDLVIGNANRHLYEGNGDRSAVIEVSTSSGLRAPPASVTRYVAKGYLDLGDNGRPTMKDAGGRYRLRPGDVLDQGGNAPELAAYRRELEQTKAGLWRKFESGYTGGETSLFRQNSYDGLTSYQRKEDAWQKYLKEHLSVSSVIRLLEAGSVDAVSTTVTDTAWGGRSLPGNLVDGHTAAGEVTAWRPAPSPLPLETGQFIRFDFQHAIAVAQLRLLIAADPSGPVPDGRTQGSWKVQALAADGQWLDVAPGTVIRNEADVIFWSIETQGRPHRSYRLVSEQGAMPADVWFSEVAFSTVEAGADPLVAQLGYIGYAPDDAKALVKAGPSARARAIEFRRSFEVDDFRWLVGQGIRTEETMRRAIELRRGSREMTRESIAREVLERPQSPAQASRQSAAALLTQAMASGSGIGTAGAPASTAGTPAGREPFPALVPAMPV